MTTAEWSAFDAYYKKIREAKREGGIEYANGAEDRIVRRLLAMGLDVRKFEVDVADDGRHVAAARYLETFPD